MPIKNIYPLTNIIRTYLEEFTDTCTKIFTTLLLTITAMTNIYRNLYDGKQSLITGHVEEKYLLTWHYS